MELVLATLGRHHVHHWKEVFVPRIWAAGTGKTHLQVGTCEELGTFLTFIQGLMTKSHSGAGPPLLSLHHLY